MTSECMDFECMNCGRGFEGRWFDIGRCFERVHYLSPEAIDQVEVADAEEIGVFCSQGCLDAGRTPLMQAQGVPIPSIRPGIGPIEQCAKCAGPVDMSDWHRTYTDGEFEQEQFSIQPIDLDYIAVICRECAPRHRVAAVGQGTEHEATDLIC